MSETTSATEKYTLISSDELERVYVVIKQQKVEIERLEGLNQELSNQLRLTQIELEQLQAEIDAYDRYIAGEITLTELETLTAVSLTTQPKSSPASHRGQGES